MKPLAIGHSGNSENSLHVFFGNGLLCIYMMLYILSLEEKHKKKQKHSVFKPDTSFILLQLCILLCKWLGLGNAFNQLRY